MLVAPTGGAVLALLLVMLLTGHVVVGALSIPGGNVHVSAQRRRRRGHVVVETDGTDERPPAGYDQQCEYTPSILHLYRHTLSAIPAAHKGASAKTYMQSSRLRPSSAVHCARCGCGSPGPASPYSVEIE